MDKLYTKSINELNVIMSLVTNVANKVEIVLELLRQDKDSLEAMWNGIRKLKVTGTSLERDLAVINQGEEFFRNYLLQLKIHKAALQDRLKSLKEFQVKLNLLIRVC